MVLFQVLLSSISNSTDVEQVYRLKRSVRNNINSLHNHLINIVAKHSNNAKILRKLRIYIVLFAKYIF